MSKKILLTGSTDGIGRETAILLAKEGHTLLLHGRNPTKLEALKSELSSSPAKIETHIADLSKLESVDAFATAVLEKHDALDVVINNAGIFVSPELVTTDQLDIRFAVNTIAPYRLTQRWLPLLGTHGRVVNLSSAAQAPVDLDALTGQRFGLSDQEAYAQSKLAITAWSRVMARNLGDQGPAIYAVNPGSLLATKMVKDAFGVAGSDIRVGVDILRRAALSDEFEGRSGAYYDNDAGRFGPPHPSALDDTHAAAIVEAIEGVLKQHAKPLG